MPMHGLENDHPSSSNTKSKNEEGQGIGALMDPLSPSTKMVQKKKFLHSVVKVQVL